MLLHAGAFFIYPSSAITLLLSASIPNHETASQCNEAGCLISIDALPTHFFIICNSGYHVRNLSTNSMLTPSYICIVENRESI